MSKQKIKIDVVSDVVCPWCYIGKRRLEKAINVLSDKYEFDVVYHPFELNPNMPAEGVSQKEHLIAKFGGEQRYYELTDRVARVAADEGLVFEFDKQNISPNTRNAHRIIQFAKQSGIQQEVKEGFMKAYFSDGVDLSKNENLVSVAVAAGLNKDAVEELVAGDDGLAEVVLAEKEMQNLGITGVPFYIIQNKFGLSGAQPSDTFVKVIEDAVSKTEAV